MNRSEYLIRQLNYYASVGYQHWISIGDSSSPSHLLQTREAISKLQGKLKIIYRECPGMNDSECFAALAEAVKTPYAVYIADDDFLVPDGLEQCVQFLEKHPDYSAVHGKGVMFALDMDGPHGKMINFYEYPQPVVEQSSAADRLKDHLSDYKVSLFSVHRTEIWGKMFGRYNLPDRTFSAEILPCCLSVIHGKVAELDSLYLVRQAHAGRYLMPLPSEWVNNEKWGASFETFQKVLAADLAKKDAISTEDARRAVSDSFGVYINDSLAREKQNRMDQRSYLSKVKSSLKQKIKARLFERYRLLPIWQGIRRIKYMILALRDGMKGGILKTWLSPKSPYHKEFMPVYRAIVELPKEVN